MNILDILRQLRDDIKTWTTNNLNYLNNKIEANKTALETRADKLEAAMPKIVILSQEEYEALEATNTVDKETFYLIKD